MRFVPGLIALAVLGGLTVLALSIVGRGNETVEVSGGHVYSVVAAEPSTLNPFVASDATATRRVLPFTHEALCDRDPETGDLRPCLATDWRVGPDGREITFTLRGDARFADGSPVAPRDVRFTWEAYRSPGLDSGSIGYGLELIDEVRLRTGEGPARLVVRVARPHFAALERIATRWVVVSRRDYLARLADLDRRDGGTGEAPPVDAPRFGELSGRMVRPAVGSGPYRLAQWRRGEEVLLTANPHSWQRRERGAWKLAGMRLRFLTGDTAPLEALLDGRLDLLVPRGATPEELLAEHPELAGRYEPLRYRHRRLGYFFVEWNCRRPPLDDARVRRALTMLFDREAIVEKLLRGAGRVASAPFRPGSPEYPEEPPLPFDPDRAKALLTDAGFGPGEPLEVEVLVPSENRLFENMVTLAAAAGQRIGVHLEVRSLPYTSLSAEVDEGRHQGACYLRSLLGPVDPYDEFHSSQRGEGGANTMGFAHPGADRVLEQARATFDRSGRAASYRRFCAILRDQQPVTFLAHPEVAILFNARIRDAEPGPLGLWPERWWVPEEFQRQ